MQLVLQPQTSATFLQQSQPFWKILLKIIVPIVLPTFLKYGLLFYSSILKSIASEQTTQRRSKNLRVNCRKTGQHTSVQCTESQIVLKTGHKKLYLPTDVSRSASSCNVACNYIQSGLRIFFTVFLETETQLWKLI